MCFVEHMKTDDTHELHFERIGLAAERVEQRLATRRLSGTTEQDHEEREWKARSTDADEKDKPDDEHEVRSRRVVRV